MNIFYDVALQLSCVLDVFPPMLCAESLQRLRNVKRRESDLHSMEDVTDLITTLGVISLKETIT